jgi:F5/8 type C domain
MNQTSNRKKNVVAAAVVGLGAALLASGCAAGVGTDEDVGSADQAFTVVAGGGVCAVHNQVAAEIMRAAMTDLGRYRPGLDLVKQNGPFVLTQTGLARCAARGGCTTLKSLLSYQSLTNQDTDALKGEFPYMGVLQPSAISNALASGVQGDYQNPHPEQVMTHDLTFAYSTAAPPINANGCGGDFTYHCFGVTGLPPGKTVTDLANNLKSLYGAGNNVGQLLRIFVDGSNNLCIDPDGTGGDTTGGGSTGGNTCVDGTMAISYDPSFVGNCCSTPSGTGFLVQNAGSPLYMSCKLTDLAAVPGTVASADSFNPAFPASNAIDADLNTLWKANDTAPNHSVKIDLGSNVAFKGVVFKFEAAGAYGYKVETSTTNIVWNLRRSGTSAANATSQDAGMAGTTARYVRVTLTSMPAGMSGALSSVRIYN